MTKIRKQKRKKTFKYTNKKRLYKKSKNQKKITCGIIKNEWDKCKTTKANLEDMGLVFDVNKGIGSTGAADVETDSPKKKYVAELLEQEAKAPREKKFRLPNGEVLWITQMLDKYNEDYKAMSRDKKNINQLTWKQIRAKINTFKKIPEQYNEYLKSKENDSLNMDVVTD